MTVPSNEGVHEQFKPWATLTQVKSFLCSEFLMWLWYLSETNMEFIKIQAGPEKSLLSIRIWLDDRLILESGISQARTQSLKGGNPSRSWEADSALRTGKSVKEIRIGLDVESIGEFSMLLSSRDLNPKAINLPGIPKSDTKGTESFDLEYRLKMTSLAIEILDALFVNFIELRGSNVWQTSTRQLIDEWIEERGHSEN